MRTSRDFATHHAKINRFVPAFLDSENKKGTIRLDKRDCLAHYPSIGD
jgi:hypothetical protein